MTGSVQEAPLGPGIKCFVAVASYYHIGSGQSSITRCHRLCVIVYKLQLTDMSTFSYVVHYHDYYY